MGDADGKQAAGKAFYDRARRIHQNDHDAKLYTSLGALSCHSLTSFPEKTLESIWCEQEHGPISSLP